VKPMFNRITTIRNVLAMALFAMGLSSYTSIAAADQSADFVDSVYSWGSWDLGLEPAAGGPVIPPKTVVNVQTRNMQFRPNDNNAFAGNAKPMVSAGNNPAPAPARAPTGPATMTPLPPGTTGPTGGPSLF